MRVDVMVDIETLGKSADSTVFQISGVAFDILTGDVISKFNKIADIEKNEEMNTSGATIKWWLNTNKELLAKLLNEGEGSSEELLENFHSWITGLGKAEDVYLWGNGILFDNRIIQHQLNKSGLGYPVYYKNDRDVRTILDLASAKTGLTEKEIRQEYMNDKYVAHDAIDDVMYQIDLVVGCYKKLIN